MHVVVTVRSGTSLNDDRFVIVERIDRAGTVLRTCRILVRNRQSYRHRIITVLR